MPTLQEIFVQKTLKNKKIKKNVDKNIRKSEALKGDARVKAVAADLNSAQKAEILSAANHSAKIASDADNLFSPDRVQMYQRDKLAKDITIKKSNHKLFVELGRVKKQNFIGQTEFVNDRLSADGVDASSTAVTVNQATTNASQPTSSGVVKAISTGANLLSSILGGGVQKSGSTRGLDYSATLGREDKTEVKILGLPAALFWTLLVIFVIVGLYALSSSGKPATATK